MQSVSSTSDSLKTRVNSVVQIASTTISSLVESYGLPDSSRGLALEKNLSDAKFLDDEDALKEEEEEEDSEMKSETA